MGGETYPSCFKDVEFCSAQVPPSSWDTTTMPDMQKKRARANSVLLPDESVLVIGGFQSYDQATGKPKNHNLDAEFYKLSTNSWTLTPPMASKHGDHSNGMLLASGKVIVGGGEERSWDYEIYSPPYIFRGPKPVITSGPTNMTYYLSQYTVYHEALSAPIEVERVVLMRPGSLTHNSCMDQRYIRLWITGSGNNSVKFSTPPNANYAPKGWYMLFLVTNAGVPSVARWVNLQ